MQSGRKPLLVSVNAESCKHRGQHVNMKESMDELKSMILIGFWGFPRQQDEIRNTLILTQEVQEKDFKI